MSKIAVLGHGVVGSGVVELFYKNKEKIEKQQVTNLISSTFSISESSPTAPIKINSQSLSTIS